MDSAWPSLEAESLALRSSDSGLWLLDQSRLPQEESWLACDSAAQLVDMIRQLQVRGAPMIALASSMLLAHLTRAGAERPSVAAAIELLAGARPTAVNLHHAMDAARTALAREDWRPAIHDLALALFTEDRALCERMADRGADLVPPGARLMTHCNTGGLATAGVGTAVGVIRRAHERGLGVSAWVCETRPLLQGARLTAWELGRLGVPYQLLCDSMAATLMAQDAVDQIWVGADRIAANGDFANKIGTYALAVAAAHHGVPFYVVAPHTTVDLACDNGAAIPIESRPGAEVQGVRGAFGACRWSPASAPTFNPGFDVTPAKLVTAWVLDHGLYDQAGVRAGALRES
ncbi:MAG: S-methyl-5-thioribose-1-phosphate isomerase [Pseudomonadota bacterium]|nr:S-methyl-5-thioribose-1-phosphate isomerase [Pseudomonadota bacterium]